MLHANRVKQASIAVALAAMLLTIGCGASNKPEGNVLGLLAAASNTPAIQITTRVNGDDSNAAPGPSVEAGSTVDLAYEVSNIGDVALADVSVASAPDSAVTCPGTDLAPGESMTCSSSSTAASGQNVSMGTVTATGPDGGSVAATAVASFQGVTQQQQVLSCDAGGPYAAECQGAATTIQLTGSGSGAEPGTTLTFSWTTDCPGTGFDDPASATPTLTVDASGSCSTECTVTLTVNDGVNEPSSCDAVVTVSDTQPPTFTVLPQDLTLDCADSASLAQAQTWLAAVAATDTCGAATVTNDFTELSKACPASGPLTVTWTATDSCGLTATTSAVLTVTDAQPPTFTAVPPDLTLECGDPDNAAKVEAWLAQATAGDNCSDVAVTNDFTELPDACGGANTITVTWTATDACGETATASAGLTVADTIPPVITLNGDAEMTLECHIDAYTELGATVVDQCDTELTDATIGGDVVDVNTPGTYVVTYNATDACGNPATEVTRTVTVVDTTPPAVTIGAAPQLWPPNHQYETLNLSDCAATLEDACEGPLDINAAGTILSIYSDEAEDAKGVGDGNTSDDIVILGPSSFKVRVERDGKGNGRVYGINFTVADDAGNETTATCFVGVPHDQSGKPAEDDGPDAGYTVCAEGATCP
jgi:hypothetical protein